MASTGVAQRNGEAVSAWGAVATEVCDSLLPGWQAAVTASFVRQGLSSLRRRQLAPSSRDGRTTRASHAGAQELGEQPFTWHKEVKQGPEAFRFCWRRPRSVARGWLPGSAVNG